MKLDLWLGNDAGVIGVFDDASMREVFNLDYHTEHELEFVELPPGKYKIGLYINDTYKGDVGMQVILEVKDGSRGLVFGDPCYAFGDNEWSELLDATAYLNHCEPPVHTRDNKYDDYYDFSDMSVPIAVVGTGGDGNWDAFIEINKYEED